MCAVRQVRRGIGGNTPALSAHRTPPTVRREAAVLRKDRNTIRTGLRLLARRHPLSHSPGTFAPRDRDFVPAATTRERLHTQSVEPSGTRGRAGGGAQDGEHAGLDIFYGFWRTCCLARCRRARACTGDYAEICFRDHSNILRSSCAGSTRCRPHAVAARLGQGGSAGHAPDDPAVKPQLNRCRSCPAEKSRSGPFGTMPVGLMCRWLA